MEILEITGHYVEGDPHTNKYDGYFDFDIDDLEAFSVKHFDRFTCSAREAAIHLQVNLEARELKGLGWVFIFKLEVDSEGEISRISTQIKKG